MFDDEITPWTDAGKMVAIRITSDCNEKNAKGVVSRKTTPIA